MIKTIIVEDNLYIQNHLVHMLSEDDRFSLIGAYEDAFDVIDICKEEHVDLVLMDVQTLHNHSGLAAGERIRREGATKVVAVTSLIDPDVLGKAKNGAADSLWYKDHGDDSLIEVLQKTMDGERIFPQFSPSVEIGEMLSKDISPRQVEILRRFIKGMTYDEIAMDLKITKNGVRWNLDQIVEKGGFANKHELLAAVIENRLIVTTLKEV